MSYLGQAPSNAVITSSQLADGVVTTPKLADNAVTDVKVSAITLLDRSINTTANIALSKLADGSSITLANVNNAWIKAQAGYTVSSSETGAFTFDYDTYQNFVVTLGLLWPHFGTMGWGGGWSGGPSHCRFPRN